MLVNCVAYQDGRKLADIAPDEIGQFVGRPECFVWVALRRMRRRAVRSDRNADRRLG